ncbi:uncharacterized protein LOC103568587 [Microplitis demolitor]|uniref:uncharacterized protein LOC103568587 n=1 Tax=Microplitis demolitor TaxID=69319 RepID=UPI0004CDAC3B|nr:uncharacterized protein LOC103568587 [Microplitis demolitor]
MNNTGLFDGNQISHVKFIIIKFIEYILLWTIVGLHLYSVFPTDVWSWMFLDIGSEIGYFIIISVLFLSGIFKIRINRIIHGFFNLIGFVLFIVSGIRIIYVFKNKNIKVIQDLTTSFPGSHFEDLEHAIIREYVRGSLNIVEGLILLIDSILSLKKIV